VHYSAVLPVLVRRAQEASPASPLVPIIYLLGN
jgi:hypothetical protein